MRILCESTRIFGIQNTNIMAEVKTGYMHKCGKSVKSWKRRWFVLKSNGYLYYFENSTSKTDKGKIDVIDADKVAPWQEVATAERKLPSGFSQSNTFAVVTGGRTYTCVCENDGDSVSWINAIQKVRQGATNGDQEQQYPPPTYPKEEPVAVKNEAPLSSAPPPSKPPPYTPSAAATSGPPPAAPRMPNPLDYGGNLPYQQPGSAAPQGYNTLPKPNAPPRAQAGPPPQAPPTQGYHTLPKPAQNQQRSASFTGAAPPPGGPGYTGGYPMGNYQPQPSYPPRPPTQYQQPYQQPYAPQPQYRPPPPVAAQPQYNYRPPPAQQQYRPPPPQAQYRPPPPQPQYRPPQQVNYRPPYQSYSQPPPPRRVVQQRPAAVQRSTTTVTVVTIPAATTQYVVRR